MKHTMGMGIGNYYKPFLDNANYLREFWSSSHLSSGRFSFCRTASSFVNLYLLFFRFMQRLNVNTNLIDISRMANSCMGSVKQLMKKRIQSA